MFFIAYIAQTAEHYDNPMLAREFKIFNFLRHPDVMLLQGLILKFKPVDLDVLPLYIVLLLASPARSALASTEAGGIAEYLLLAPFKEDGHFLVDYPDLCTGLVPDCNEILGRHPGNGLATK